MQAPCPATARAEQLTLCIWETEIQPAGEGRAVIVARKPLSRMSSAQAAKILGCTEWTVRKLYRMGLLSGWKPGAARKRRDGRASNAALVLDAGSVLKYKQEVSRRGV
jgi:hypothetical protein